MAEWTRSTPWRQGSILDHKLLAALAQGHPNEHPAPNIGVVVSHDCDIAANPRIEPNIEVIPATFLPEEDGSLTHAKDPRRLHLTLTKPATGQKCFAEFNATEKRQISKEQLANALPSDDYFLPAKELEILRRWLAARYRRHAFSDEFEKRFRKVEDKLREALKKSSSHLRAILFDLDDDSGADSTGAESPYALDIYLIYTSQSNPGESLRVAESTKEKIEKAFKNKYKQSGEWTEIELRSCEVVSDKALTYSQYLELAEWRSEGLSLKSDPIGPMTEENS
jgi:hypothetical protein